MSANCCYCRHAYVEDIWYEWMCKKPGRIKLEDGFLSDERHDCQYYEPDTDTKKEMVDAWLDCWGGNQYECSYCKANENCHKGVVGYPNGPHYPVCSDGDKWDMLLDKNKLIEDILNGEWPLPKDMTGV